MIDVPPASLAQHSIPGGGRDPNLIEPVVYCWGSREGDEPWLCSGPPPWFGAQCPGARPPVWAHAAYVVEDEGVLSNTVGLEDAYSSSEAAVVCRVLAVNEMKV